MNRQGGWATGIDTETGGAGADIFRLDGPAPRSEDTFTDFTSGEDRVALSKAGFGIAGLSDFDIVSSRAGPFEGKATLIVDLENHALSWDADGDGADAAILLAHGAFTTSAADYMVF